jgi:recombination protein RecR
MLPAPIQNLTESIASLPGIGKKGASKLVLDYLLSDRSIQDAILKAFIDTRQQVTKCTTCNYLSESNQECLVCQSTSRFENQFMVVHSAFDVVPIENNHVYNGKYHVLEKLISPLDGILPSNTTVIDLEHRIDKFLREDKVANLELIYFVKHSFQAATTYAYIEDYVSTHKHKDRIKLSKLATGLPTNFNIQSIDQESFKIAYENRK